MKYQLSITYSGGGHVPPERIERHVQELIRALGWRVESTDHICKDTNAPATPAPRQEAPK